MRKWGKSSAGDAAGALLFFALAASCAVALSCFLTASGREIYHKPPGDFLLMTVQCALGLLGMALPAFLDRKWRLQLPGCAFTLIYVFLFCAVFLGEVLSFYYVVPHWDTLLHFFSGVMLGMLGFSLSRRLNGAALSPLLTATFAFCFALAAGAVWEIYEYVMDGILQMNMQKFADAQQRDYVGRGALQDTMKDVIVDALSALLTAAVGYGIVRKRGRRQ